ncbi:MAG: phosphate ABC transporter substrate-binding protein [Phycisphaerae bacterium]
MIRNLAVVAALAMVAASTAVAEEAKTAAVKGTLQIEGSTTVGPIADAFAEAFKRLYPDVTITVKKTGSGDGAAALVDGRCQIATMSRFMKAEEFKKAVDKGGMPVAHAIAMDGVCVVVHPSNQVSGLTLEQVRDIYTGKIANWKELGGADAAIVVISRDTSSGTYESFNHIVMGKAKMFEKVEYVSANPQAQARVTTTPGAIAYVGLGFVDDKVKALPINGIAPNKKTISTGVYPISRPLFLFTNGYPDLGSAVHAFCTFYLTEKGQEIIEAKGFVPVTSY